MKSEPDCYGKMFPAAATPVLNRPESGKVFGYRADYSGMVARDRVASVDRDAWRQCVACSEFKTCYRLSCGRLLMDLVLRTLPQSFYGS